MDATSVKRGPVLMKRATLRGSLWLPTAQMSSRSLVRTLPLKCIARTHRNAMPPEMAPWVKLTLKMAP